MNWKQEQKLSDLRRELDTLCKEITLTKSIVPLNQEYLYFLEKELLTTYNHAIKCGLYYKLEDL